MGKEYTQFSKDRESSRDYQGNKSAEFIEEYRRTKNTSGRDGLPGRDFPERSR